MKNLNPLYYITEDKVVNNQISQIGERIRDIPKIYKDKFNSNKNGPTFWDLNKINRWKKSATTEVGMDLQKALNKKKVVDGLKKGSIKLLKRVK